MHKSRGILSFIQKVAVGLLLTGAVHAGTLECGSTVNQTFPSKDKVKFAGCNNTLPTASCRINSIVLYGSDGAVIPVTGIYSDAAGNVSLPVIMFNAGGRYSWGMQTDLNLGVHPIGTTWTLTIGWTFSAGGGEQTYENHNPGVESSAPIQGMSISYPDNLNVGYSDAYGVIFPGNHYDVPVQISHTPKAGPFVYKVDGIFIKQAELVDTTSIGYTVVWADKAYPYQPGTYTDTINLQITCP